MSKEIRALVAIYSNGNVLQAIKDDENVYDDLELPDRSKYGRDMIHLYYGMENAIYSMGDTINELSVENISLKDVLKSDPNKLKQAMENRDKRLQDQTNKEKNDAIIKACKEAEIKRQKGYDVTPALIYSKKEDPKKGSDIDKIRRC